MSGTEKIIRGSLMDVLLVWYGRTQVFIKWEGNS
jgi:hypothetical protein